MIDEHLTPGTLVAERYRIVRLLGQGGMGAVYLAEHVRVGRAVALKVLASRWASDGPVVRRFREEARAASAAGHPNIIEVFDAGELVDGRPFLVMEHIEGRELYQEVQHYGRLDVPRACRILRDVARALEAAHAAGIVHRDLKGENVMLVERGGQELVKVLDFGIAANAAAMGGRATTPGQIMGTPIYMAPEQAQGDPVTTAFDVYALGVLLHEALTGSPPFPDHDGMALLVLKTKEPAPSIATVLDDLPADLVALVDSCLALDPAERPTVRDVVRRLDLVLERQEGTGARFEPTTVLRGPLPSPRRRVVLPAMLLVLLSVGVGAWVLHDESPAGEGLARGGVERIEAPLPEIVTPEPEPEPKVATPEPEPEVTTLEPEPEVATPEPEPEPEPEPGRPSRAGEPSGASESVAVTGLCWRTRKQARQAREGHDWPGMLRHTRNASCWSEQRDERRRLQAKAYMELGQWSACITASRGLQGDQARQWERTCRRRQEQG